MPDIIRSLQLLPKEKHCLVEFSNTTNAFAVEMGIDLLKL